MGGLKTLHVRSKQGLYYEIVNIQPNLHRQTSEFLVSV